MTGITNGDVLESLGAGYELLKWPEHWPSNRVTIAEGRQKRLFPFFENIPGVSIRVAGGVIWRGRHEFRECARGGFVACRRKRCVVGSDHILVQVCHRR